MNARKARAIRRIANTCDANPTLMDHLNSVFMDMNLVRKGNSSLSLSRGAFYKNLKKGFHLLKNNRIVGDGMHKSLLNFANTGVWINPGIRPSLVAQAETYVYTIINYRMILMHTEQGK